MVVRIRRASSTDDKAAGKARKLCMMVVTASAITIVTIIVSNIMVNINGHMTGAV